MIGEVLKTDTPPRFSYTSITSSPQVYNTSTYISVTLVLNAFLVSPAGIIIEGLDAYELHQYNNTGEQSLIWESVYSGTAYFSTGSAFVTLDTTALSVDNAYSGMILLIIFNESNHPFWKFSIQQYLGKTKVAKLDREIPLMPTLISGGDVVIMTSNSQLDANSISLYDGKFYVALKHGQTILPSPDEFVFMIDVIQSKSNGGSKDVSVAVNGILPFQKTVFGIAEVQPSSPPDFVIANIYSSSNVLGGWNTIYVTLSINFDLRGLTCTRSSFCFSFTITGLNHFQSTEISYIGGQSKDSLDLLNWNRDEGILIVYIKNDLEIYPLEILQFSFTLLNSMQVVDALQTYVSSSSPQPINHRQMDGEISRIDASFSFTYVSLESTHRVFSSATILNLTFSLNSKLYGPTLFKLGGLRGFTMLRNDSRILLESRDSYLFRNVSFTAKDYALRFTLAESHSIDDGQQVFLGFQVRNPSADFEYMENLTVSAQMFIL
eukprot:768667-Hanusia_phi.AAC.2